MQENKTSLFFSQQERNGSEKIIRQTEISVGSICCKGLIRAAAPKWLFIWSMHGTSSVDKNPSKNVSAKTYRPTCTFLDWTETCAPDPHTVWSFSEGHTHRHAIVKLSRRRHSLMLPPAESIYCTPRKQKVRIRSRRRVTKGRMNAVDTQNLRNRSRELLISGFPRRAKPEKSEQNRIHLPRAYNRRYGDPYQARRVWSEASVHHFVRRSEYLVHILEKTELNLVNVEHFVAAARYYTHAIFLMNEY